MATTRKVATQRAAAWLGFTRRYLTTDSSDDFVRALKTFLSKGRAVRVAVDRSLLLEDRGVSAGALVLIGYDESGFEYYEPTCDTEKRCAPGEKPKGAPGLKVPTDQLLLAAESLALAYQYPWKYQLVVLEPAATPAKDLGEILFENGKALVGEKTQGPSLGSVLVGDTAKAVARHGADVVTPELLRGVSVAAQVRRENAEALAALFSGRPELAAISETLDEASKQYGVALKALEAKEFDDAVSALESAAKYELAAGTALTRAADGGR
jgi:hypothetical protein